MPFLGWLVAGDRFFTQGFLQFDFDVNGNAVSLNPFGTGLIDAGRVHDTELLYLDVGFGFWLWKNPCAFLSAVAPTVEFHYNASLDVAEFAQIGNFRVGQPFQNVQILNVVAGSTFEFGQNSTLTLGYSTTVGNPTDRQFDGEIRAFWNRFF